MIHAHSPTRRLGERRRRTLTFLILVLISTVYIAPFLWLVLTSFKTTQEVASDPPVWLPLQVQDPQAQKELAIDRFAPAFLQRAAVIKANYYQRVLADPAIDFMVYARNTLIIAALGVTGSVVSSSLVAYALAKLHWHGRNAVFSVCLATMMLPFSVVMVPQYEIFRRLGWIGTTLPLWVPAFFGVPFFIFLLRQFYVTIPDELLDAARIDGCSEFRIWWQIILPLSRPALAVVAVFAFLGAWNDFLAPLVYLVHKQQFTLSLALQFFQSRSGGTSWELLAAASVMVLLPVIALFFLAQKTFVQGIATTGLKG